MVSRFKRKLFAIDFYVVYNDFRGVNRLNSVPEIPSFFGRTVMVKYTHTFIL